MKFELLKQADYVLNACGRPTPPPGYTFIDLFRIIPFHFDTVGQSSPGAPFNQAITNNADTLFLCMGVALRSKFMTRIKWPTGRFLSQNMEFNAGQEASPQGVGSSMVAFQNPIPIDPDQRITVQISGVNISGTEVDVQFWGVLRDRIKTDSASNGGSANAGSSDASCIIGYAAKPFTDRPSSLETIPDPVAALKALPRYQCTPNQNIMAPEYRLGNQCTPETPDDSQDESFTFFSPVISIPANGEVYGIPVIVPGGSDDVVIRNLTFYVTLTGDGFSAIPVLQIRLPNGYSIMGGDEIPVVTDFNFIPSVFQLPVFPTLRVRSGDRIIVDAADMLVTGSGVSTVLIQFDGCKRRKRS